MKRSGGYFERDYAIKYREIEDGNPNDIFDPRSWTNHDKYSAERPDDAKNLLPPGVAPYTWIKTHCWIKREETSENWSGKETAGMAIATAIFPIPVGFFWFAPRKNRVVIETKICHFQIYDHNGKLINEQDRVVSTDKKYPNAYAGGGSSLGPMAQQEAVNTNPGPGIPESTVIDEIEKKEKLKKKAELTSDSNSGSPVSQDGFIYDVRLYASDLNPSDSIEEYVLIDNTKVSQTWFKTLNMTIKPNGIYKGSDLMNSLIRHAAPFDANKYYEIISIEPLGHRRRNIDSKETYNLGILPSSEVHVYMKLKQN